MLVGRPDAEAGSTPAVFVDPSTARVLGEGSARSPFFSAVLTLHRSLFADTVGRIAVELATSWTLVLLVSGLYLWVPARWTDLWGVWLPRLRANPYLVLRDLHTVGGLLFTPVLALIAFTGLFFTVVWLWSFNTVAAKAGDFPRELLAAPPVEKPSVPPPPTAIDAAVAAARERFPTHNLSVQLPKKPTDAYAVTARGDSGSSVSGSVAVEPATGRVVSAARAEDLPPAAQARLYVLPVHMGTIGGTATKVLAFAACLALAVLAVSGVWMWLARRPEGRWGFPRASAARVPKLAVVLILLLAVLLPTVGLSLVVVLAGEWVYGRLTRRTADPATTDTPLEVPVLPPVVPAPPAGAGLTTHPPIPEVQT